MEIAEAKRRARSGPMLLLARRALVLLITFVSTITVSRLVGPTAYGLANMATVILAFGQVFRDFGLTNAVLRKGQISPDEMSFIFWFNAAMTVGLAVIIAIGSPFIAEFYNQPIVMPVVLVSLMGFITGGLALQHRALINRELRFGTIALIDVAALLTGFLVTLTLAIIRRDVWAIVIGTVVQSAVGCALSVAMSGWRPSRYKRPAELASLLKFGANTSIFSLAVFFSNNAAVVLIGHFLGPSSLGQYNRAQVLYGLPSANLVQPITQATMPLLTRLRAHPEEYRAAYLSLVRKLCIFLIPISAILMITAPPLVRVLLGRNWNEAGLVLAMLAPTLGAVGIAYAISDLFITQDRSSELRTIGLYEMVFRVGSVTAFVQFGLVGAAFGFTASTIFVAFIRLMIVGRKGPVTRRDQIRAMLPAIPMGVGAAVGCMLAAAIISTQAASDLVITIALSLSGGVGALIVGIVLPASRSALLELAEVFGMQTLMKRLRRSAAGK